jgi:hypothetical protein
MHTRPRPVQLRLLLPAADYRVFILAARILRRVMGRKAPTRIDLIQHCLTERRANSVADDYLEWVGWPQGRRPAVSAGKRVACRGLRTPVLRPVAMVDPTRN